MRYYIPIGEQLFLLSRLNLIESDSRHQRHHLEDSQRMIIDYEYTVL